MILRGIERILLAVGLTLCAVFLAMLVYREVGSRLAIRSFEAAAAQAQSQSASKPSPALRDELSTPDYSLWATKRIAGYKESLLRQFSPPLAILRIPKIHLEVAVFSGTDEWILNRGVGLIDGTARIGDSGNVGIAGHRDGFFRGLKDVAVGDPVTLTTASATTNYAVDQIEIVTPQDVRVLGPRPTASLTLVTCYPFYYTGDAPKRYIVHCAKR